MIQTLWDLLKPKRPAPPPGRRKLNRAERSHSEESAPSSAPRPLVASRRGSVPAESMEARYERVTRQMLDQYRVRVRRWRTSMSGIAWELRYRDGSVKRLIEAPRPRGPVSAAIFLHEIGHHAIGFNRYRPRCLEEFHAWDFALKQMEVQGLNVTPAVHTRVRRSLRYAVAKARRRGIREVPAELAAFA